MKQAVYDANVTAFKTMLIYDIPKIDTLPIDYRSKWATINYSYPIRIVSSRNSSMVQQWIDFLQTRLIGSSFYCGVPIAAFADSASEEQALYHFDANFNDSYSNTPYNLTASGAVVSFLGAKFGIKGAYFDGSNDYAFQNGALFDTVPTPGAIGFWFKPLTTIDGSSTKQYLFYKNQDANNEISCYIDTDGSLKFVTKLAGTTFTFQSSGASATNTINKDLTYWDSNMWYHVLCFWETARTGLWIDGNLVDVQTGQVPCGNGATGDFYLGAKNNTPDNPFAGYIDELRVYDGTDTPSRTVNRIWAAAVSPIRRDDHVWSAEILIRAQEFEVQIK